MLSDLAYLWANFFKNRYKNLNTYMPIYSVPHSTAPVIPFSNHSRQNAEQTFDAKKGFNNSLRELVDALFPEDSSTRELARSAASLLSVWGIAMQAGLFTISPLVGVGVPLVVIALLIVLKISTTISENRHYVEARNVMEPDGNLISSLLTVA